MTKFESRERNEMGYNEHSFDSLFWKNHHELCGWRVWERPVLLEVAEFHRRPQCTMTCYSSKWTNKRHVNICTNAAQCSVAAVPAGDSPVCHSASCLQDEGGVHLSVWPSAVPDHSAHCSSPLWSMGQFKCVRHDLNEREEHVAGLLTLYEKTSVTVIKTLSSAATEGRCSLSSRLLTE